MTDQRSLDLFDDYPATPGHKGGETSRQAAQKMAARAPLLRTRIISALNKSTGLTADECAAQIGENILSVRPRFSELSRDGIIEKTGQRRANESGMNAAVWRVIPMQAEP